MARVRILLCPFAGGGPAVFHRWRALLPEEIEPWALSLPGREGRLHEPPLTAWAPLIEETRKAVSALPFRFDVLFGASFGAVLAGDLVGHLAAAHRSGGPVEAPTLILAGPPGRTSRADWAGYGALPDGAFLAQMAERLGPPPASFDDLEVRAAALPGLKADLALLSTRMSRDDSLVEAPDGVILAADDPNTPHAKDAYREAPLYLIDGGHFTPIQSPEQTVNALLEVMARSSASPTR